MTAWFLVGFSTWHVHQHQPTKQLRSRTLFLYTIRRQSAQDVHWSLGAAMIFYFSVLQPPTSSAIRKDASLFHIIRDAYSSAHTSTWSTSVVLTSSIYHWVRPYRPLSRKRRLHLIFDTDPRLGMIPKFFFKPYLQRNLTYSCNQNFYLLFERVKSRITRQFLLF